MDGIWGKSGFVKDLLFTNTDTSDLIGDDLWLPSSSVFILIFLHHPAFLASVIRTQLCYKGKELLESLTTLRTPIQPIISHYGQI